MDIDSFCMDKTNPSGLPPKPSQRRLLHGKVPGDYFFLELGERHKGPLAVAFGGREYCSLNYQVQRRTYPFVTLEFVASGQGELRLGDSPPVRLSPGSVFAYGPSLQVSMTTRDEKMTKYFVCLAGSGAKELLTAPVDLWGRCLNFSAHTQLREIFDLMVREGQEHGPKTEALCLNSFGRLHLKLEQAQLMIGNAPDPFQESFLRCKLMVNENPARFASLGDLASAGGVSLPTLHRLFRRYQGVTPYQYLTRQKMNQAAQDLIGTDMLVKEVAAKIGFADPLHFSRVFRNVHGVSPLQLRQSLRDSSKR
jgi:AraC family transcriptional regulator